MALLTERAPDDPRPAREHRRRASRPAARRSPGPLRLVAGVALAVFVTTTASVSPPPAAAATTPIREFDLKAVFLLHFTRFVEWPADAFRDSTSPVLIGVLGDDPFGPVLDEVVAGETRDGRPLRVRRSRDVSDLVDCHVVYISESEDPRLAETLATLRGRPVLTVGESESFSDSRGMIRFVLVGNHVRLRIQVAAAQEARLVISSKLLRQAELVGPGPRS